MLPELRNEGNSSFISLLPLAISSRERSISEFEIWPNVKKGLLYQDKIVLPIQVQGKLVTTIETKKGYIEKDILKLIYQLDKVKNKIQDKKVIKVINVQDKIINIITH